MTSRRGFLGILTVAPTAALLPAAPPKPARPIAATPADLELITLAMGMLGVLDAVRETPAHADVLFVAKFIRRPIDSPYHLAARIAPYYLTSGQVPLWLRFRESYHHLDPARLPA